MKTSVSISLDTFKTLKTLLFFARVCGVIPVAVSRKNDNCYILQNSFRLCVYAYVLLTFIASFCIFGFYDDLSATIPIKLHQPILKYIILVDVCELVLSAFVNAFAAPFNLRHFWNLLYLIEKIDQIDLKRQIRKHERKSDAFIVFSLIIVSSIVIYDIVLWSLLSSKLNILSSFYLRYIWLYFLFFIVLIQQAPICVFSKILQHQIAHLNSVLQTILDHSAQTNQKIANITFLTSKNTELNKNLYNNCLGDCMKFIDYVEEAVNSLNSFTGLNNLLTLSSSLLHLVIYPYYLLVEICNNGNIAYILLQTAWFTLCIGRLMVIVEACQKCLDEHQITQNIVLKLYTQQVPNNIKEKIEILTIQLTNKKICFSSFGIIKISRSLLTAFGGSVTTFLVILFQYAGTGKSIYTRNN